LVKEGSGILTLTAANGYNSLTTIGGGTLLLGFGTTTSNILPATTPLNMGLGTVYDPIPANADMIISGGGGGGTLQLAGAAASATQTVASLATATNTANRIVVGADRTLTITSGTITIGTDSALNFNTAAGGNNGATVGTSIVEFGSAPTTFTNGFTVTDSTGFGLATVNGSNQVIRNTSTTLLPASGAASPTDYRVDNNAGTSSDPGSSTLTVSANQSAASIAVDTTAASGVLTLNSGVLLSNNVWHFGAASGTNTYQVTGNAGGAGVRTVASGNTMVINNYNSGAVTFSSPILANGANALIIGGTGTVSLAGVNTFTGATTINSGVLQISGSGRLQSGTYAGAIAINGGSVLQYSSDQAQTLAGVIGGPGGITKDGAGTLILQNANTSIYTGPTLISTGRLTADRTASGPQGGLPAGSAVTISGNSSGGGQLNISNNVTTVANNFTISGVGFADTVGSTNARSGAIRVVSGNILSGQITLAGDARIGFNTASAAGPTATYSGKITGGFALEFFGMYGTNNGANAIHVFANTSAINANDYTGDTSISAIATGITGARTTLRLSASNQLPNGTGKGNLVFNGADADHLTVFELNGFNETINGLSNAAAAGAVIQNSATGASTLTIGDANATGSFSGTITDGGVGKALAITKIGGGALTLTGNNPYTGVTNVNAGTLAINGTLGAGANVINANGGVTSFGVSQTLAALNIADGATVVLAPASSPAEGEPAAGFDAPGVFGAEFNGGTGASAVAAVPEPGSVALLLGGALALLGVRRRRQA
jgi:autotransporter-associated beta strand protein